MIIHYADDLCYCPVWGFMLITKAIRAANPDAIPQIWLYLFHRCETVLQQLNDRVPCVARD